MKYMVTWKIGSAAYESAARRFVSGGAPMPAGLTMLGRWHAPGSQTGWLLAETDDPGTLCQHLAEWGNALEFDVNAVVGDEVAGKAYTAVYGG